MNFVFENTYEETLPAKVSLVQRTISLSKVGWGTLRKRKSTSDLKTFQRLHRHSSDPGIFKKKEYSSVGATPHIDDLFPSTIDDTPNDVAALCHAGLGYTQKRIVYLFELFQRYNLPMSNFQQVTKTINENFGNWNLNVYALEDLLPGYVMVVLGSLIFHEYNFEQYGLPIDPCTIEAFLLQVQSKYCKNVPFHNSVHATDVLHSMHCLIMQSKLKNILQPILKLVCLVAAVQHDIGHFGLSNRFLQETNHDLAKKNPTASLEHYHCRVGLAILDDHKFNIFAHADAVDQTKLRSLLMDCILATDIACFQSLRQKLEGLPPLTANAWLHQPDELTWTLLPVLMHAADIGAATKIYDIHSTCTKRLHDERSLENMLQHKESSEQVNPTGEIWFLSNIVEPLYLCLDKFGLDMSMQLQQVTSNIVTWQNGLVPLKK